MRFYYLDPGLHNDVGHHANTCRLVTAELRRRGIETVVAASAYIFADLKAELGAIPLFKFHTYQLGKNEPAGWLAIFLRGVEFTLQDLSQLPQPQVDDVVFLNSAQPAQLMSMVNWLNGMPMNRRPRVVIEFGTDAGLDVKQVGNTFSCTPRDPNMDPRGHLYRFIGENIPAEIRKHLFLMTFDPAALRTFEYIIGHETGVLPLPQSAYSPVRRKSGKRPITVAVMGHQRREKGYPLMPEIIPILLARHPDIQILVHNAAPQEMPEVQNAIRHLRALDWRIILDERPANDRLWHYLFAGTDIMLCPYLPSRYVTAYSAVVAEALANGLPLVVPASTSLARFLAEHGGAGVAFDDWGVQSIADATSTAIMHFDAFADQAFAAAQTWNMRDRKALLVDHILGLTNVPAPALS